MQMGSASITEHAIPQQFFRSVYFLHNTVDHAIDWLVITVPYEAVDYAVAVRNQSTCIKISTCAKVSNTHSRRN